MGQTGDYTLTTRRVGLTRPSENSRKSFYSRPGAHSASLRDSLSSPTARHVIHRSGITFRQYSNPELSDIHEVSGSSKGGTTNTRFSKMLDGTHDQRDSRLTSQPSSLGKRVVAHQVPEDAALFRPVTPQRGMPSRKPSAMSLPMKDVPGRRSSTRFSLRRTVSSQWSSEGDVPSWKRSVMSAGKVIPSRAHSNSPVRTATQRDPVSSARFQRSPSRTFIRTAPRLDILSESNIRHNRIHLSLQTTAPLCVGGGSVEGHVRLTVDGGSVKKAQPNPLSISGLSMDVAGVEEVSDGRKWIFLPLATELFDEQHPPPTCLVATQTPSPAPELSWPLRSGSAVIPFCVNLPLNVGPPPYETRKARIRYVLCATAYVNPPGRVVLVRESVDIQIFTVYDPEKALSSLATPLLAADQLRVPHGLLGHTVKLTAGLHRQTWVNGAMLYVDVHIRNTSTKTIRKVQIQLEKITFWYSHTPVVTDERRAKHLRPPKRKDSKIVGSSSVKRSKDWKPVPPHTSEARTCDLEIPRGHATISSGRYFEVRYFVNVIVHVSPFKTLAVQMPVTIIHISSLDIVPNSLAQVAASVEAKRARTVPVANKAAHSPFRQGQVFAAPRRQSLDRMRRASGSLATDDVACLMRDVNNSPRRFARGDSACGHRRRPSNSAVHSENQAPEKGSTAPSSQHHTIGGHTYHFLSEKTRRARHRASTSSLPEPKESRLQFSTSELGFSESDFEMASASEAKKVFLSRSERNMILRRRKSNLQRPASQKNQKRLTRRPSEKSSKDIRGKQNGVNQVARAAAPALGSHWGWRNVATQSIAGSGPNHETAGVLLDGKEEGEKIAGTRHRRSRSNTGPSRVRPGVSSSADRRSRSTTGRGSEGGRGHGTVNTGLGRRRMPRIGNARTRSTSRSRPVSALEF